MKSTMIVVLFSTLIIPFTSAYGSWHWSSDYEVCGTEVIKKGEKCDLYSENKNKDVMEQSENSVEKQSETYVEKQSAESMQMCPNELVPILKNTSNSLNCVKESSLEKLIQRGWGKIP